MDSQPEVTWLVLGALSLPSTLLTFFFVPRWKSQARASWETAQRLSADFPKARSDDEREALARSYGTKILRSSAGLFVSSSALLIAFILPWIAFAASNLQRAAWLTVLSAGFLAGWFKKQSPKDSHSSMSQQQYSGLDRFLHKLVLGSKVIQSTSFELQQLIAHKLPKPDRPVFVVGMARSGTTTLLNLLFATGEFESSRYRDLPLPLFPAFWRKVHKGFHQGQSPIQRAHDDGILVSPDSPEAFEEIYWDNIGNHLSEKELVQSFSYYISSIAGASGPGKRYISKNNNNITRLDLLAKVCKEINGVIIIPIRDPLKTATSSLRMHQRFITMQEEDPFVLEYMNLLGHREFGKGLQWLQVGSKAFQPSYPTTEVECWLEYWMYLHSAITQVSSSHCRMVDFDAIRSETLVKLKPMLKSCGVDSQYDQLAAMVTQEPPANLNSVSLKSPDLMKSALLLKRNLVGGE